MRGRLQGRDRLAIAAARPRDEVFDGELRQFRRNGFAWRDLAAEIAGERREIRDVGFEAPGRAAGARRTVDVDRDMAELSGDVVPAPEQLAAHDDTDAQAVGDRDVRGVAVGRWISTRGPDLRQRARAAGVLDMDREPGGFREHVAQRHIAPSEPWREQHPRASATCASDGYRRRGRTAGGSPRRERSACVLEAFRRSPPRRGALRR